MPQLDVDAMVCGDDAIVDDFGTDEEEREDPYAPADSLRFRIGADVDWSDVIGAVAVLQRDDSTKGAGANPKSAARRSAQHAAPRSSMSSAAAQRKAVAVVIGGLPPAARGKVARERRCSPCSLGGRARVFAAGEQQQAVPSHRLEEPMSPKVSCLGAVRPEKQPAGRGRRSWLATSVTCCFSSHGRARRSSTWNEADD